MKKQTSRSANARMAQLVRRCNALEADRDKARQDVAEMTKCRDSAVEQRDWAHKRADRAEALARDCQTEVQSRMDEHTKRYQIYSMTETAARLRDMTEKRDEAQREAAQLGAALANARAGIAATVRPDDQLIRTLQDRCSRTEDALAKAQRRIEAMTAGAARVGPNVSGLADRWRGCADLERQSMAGIGGGWRWESAAEALEAAIAADARGE